MIQPIFYDQWKEICGLNYTTSIKYSDTPFSFSWKDTTQAILSYEFYNAVKGNPDKNLEITISFYGMDELFLGTYNQDISLTIKNINDEDEESFGTQTVTFIGEYRYFTVKLNVPARCAQDGKIYCEFNRGNTFNLGYIKDLIFNVKFENVVY